MKKIIVIIIAVSLLTITVFAQTSVESIEVALDSINLSLNLKSISDIGESYQLDNGDVVPYSILYRGTTYLPIKKISDLIGADITWDGNTRTVGLNVDTNVVMENAIRIESLTYQNGIIDLSGLDYNKIRAGSIYYDGDYVSLDYSLNGSELTINNELPINESLRLDLYTGDSPITVHVDQVVLNDLYDGTKIKNDTVNIIKIPAMPEKGFNFDFIIVMNNFEDIRETSGPKHFFVEMINNGSVSSRDEFNSKLIYDDILNYSFTAYSTAFMMDMPVIYPLVPRLASSFYSDTTGNASFYQHSLDRDTVYYKEIVSGEMYGREVQDQVTEQVIAAGYDLADFYDLEEQIIAMVDYASDYYAANNMTMEEKIFISGYSASGSFTERFTALYPTRVRASAAGASADDFIMPTDSLRGETLMFPLGVSDYKDITGRSFDINTYNSVAKIVYMGKDDTNNVLPYNDAYGDDERDTVTTLWGNDVLSRALKMFDDFSNTEGDALFILDQGIKHGISDDLRDYLVTFFKANVGDDTPVVYPSVNKSNLETYKNGIKE